MKKKERLFNHLYFGLFFPIWYIATEFHFQLHKITFSFYKYLFSKNKYDKIKTKYREGQNFLTEIRLICIYNLVDAICGFSVMGMMLTLNDTFQSRIENFLLPYLSWENISILLFICIFIVAYVPFYLFFYRHDKREKYFTEFDKEPMKEKWKWTVLSVSLYAGMWTFVIIFHHYYAE